MNRFFFDGHWAVFLGLLIAAMLCFAVMLDHSEPLMIPYETLENWTD